MKKQLLIFAFSIIALVEAGAQIPPQEITKLKRQLALGVSDSARINILLDLSNGYRFSNIDSALFYADEAIKLSRGNALPGLEGDAISQKGYILLEAGEIPEALQDQFTALSIAEQTRDEYLEAWCLNRIGNTYMELGDLGKSLSYYKRSKRLFAQFNKTGYVYNLVSNIGNIFEMMGVLDSAKIYQQQVFEYSLTNTDRYAITYAEMRERLGNVERRLGNYDSAILHYKVGIREALVDFDQRNLAANYLQLTKLFYKLQSYDSAFRYAKKTIDAAKSISWRKAIHEASGLLTSMYKSIDQPDSALHYAELNIAVRDSLYGPQKIRQLQRITLREQERQLQLQKEKDDLQDKYRTIGLSSALAVFILIVITLWRNNIKKQKTNRQLNGQKEQLSTQRNELEKALHELKATQSQLIQSEKMASLGELTAGIAHEIQNPLNFVNNFSELNNELIDEMAEEIEKGNFEDAKGIAKDIKENQEKVTQHGKRADAIVKGMLQHSRSHSGVNEPTNINTLADEYLRLAYHGLRAKDKSFNAITKTDLDEAVGVINVIPQDIGRVIFNLIANAFYAVAEKKRQQPTFEPTVTVTTKRIGENILILVKDNGNGIDQKVLDKIFQPFFTTKPTGQGTGLGLSLSYDIVNAHGGELKVETKDGEGSEFMVRLPA